MLLTSIYICIYIWLFICTSCSHTNAITTISCSFSACRHRVKWDRAYLRDPRPLPTDKCYMGMQSGCLIGINRRKVTKYGHKYIPLIGMMEPPWHKNTIQRAPAEGFEQWGGCCCGGSRGVSIASVETTFWAVIYTRSVVYVYDHGKMKPR